MPEYTPPTTTVRYAYSMHTVGPQWKTNAEFDRWLAARDRENRAIGWDEAIKAADEVASPDYGEWPTNPYRGDNR